MKIYPLPHPQLARGILLAVTLLVVILLVRSTITHADNHTEQSITSVRNISESTTNQNEGDRMKAASSAVGNQDTTAQDSAAQDTILHEAEDALLSGLVSIGGKNDTNTAYIEFGPQTEPPPPVDTFQPSAPYHATFYYPWYKSADVDQRWSYWDDHGNEPPNTWFSHYLPDRDPTAFDPANELYTANDVDAIYWQLTKMAEAKQEVAISSWWGQGDKTDTAFRSIIADFMNRTGSMNRQGNPYPNLRWSIYYEGESKGDPSVAEIVSDLNYISDNYATQNAFLRIDGKPVIFVYAQNGDGPEMAQRWQEANQQAQEKFYVVLKVFSGYRTAPHQPDSWHQYGPASRISIHEPHAAGVSPGFWLDDNNEDVRLPRDLNKFRVAVQQMVAADVTWKLVLTWNEWGEGTSVEPGEQVRFNASMQKDEPDPNAPLFKNAYIDLLNQELPPLEAGTGAPASITASSTDESIPATGGTEKLAKPVNLADNNSQNSATTFTFAAGGDHGANEDATASLNLLANSPSEFYLALGDLSYSDIEPESAWCDYIKATLGADYPFELLVGNHEDRVGDDGHIDEFAKCLPDKLSVTGLYAHRYYFDYPANAPLARFIMIDPNTYRGDSRVEFCKDGESENCDWLKARIAEAQSQNLWVIVGAHKLCITLGDKPCEIGTELLNMLIENRVDLLLHGHQHMHLRSKPLAVGAQCPEIKPDAFNPLCVANTTVSSQYTKGKGTIIVVSGVFGTSPDRPDMSKPEAGYFAAAMGSDDGPRSNGYMQYEVSAQSLQARFVRSNGDYADNFEIMNAGTMTMPPVTPVPTCPSLPSESGTATFSIDIVDPGNYKVWTRMKVDNLGNNAFWLQVDDECPVQISGSNLGSNTWHWVDYLDGDDAYKATLALAAGQHTVKLIGSASGLKIDKLIFTRNMSCAPNGASGDACLVATGTLFDTDVYMPFVVE